MGIFGCYNTIKEEGLIVAREFEKLRKELVTLHEKKVAWETYAKAVVAHVPMYEFTWLVEYKKLKELGEV
jgi:hypothetical protein